MRTPFKAGWRTHARRFLAANPYCLDCGAPSTDADHITSRLHGGGDEWENLAARCHSCHSKRTTITEGHGLSAYWSKQRAVSRHPSTVVNQW